MKFIAFFAPFTAVVFYYVMVQQSRLDVEMDREGLKFERSWNEFKAESPFTIDKKKYEEKAKATESKIKELEEREKEKKRKLEEMERELEKELREYKK